MDQIAQFRLEFGHHSYLNRAIWSIVRSLPVSLLLLLNAVVGVGRCRLILHVGKYCC
jgi:hypothetical protein